MRSLVSFLACALMALFFSACGSSDPFKALCMKVTADGYDANFQIWCPTQGEDYFVPVNYGCHPSGEGISPPISWKGVPKEATHLRIVVEDSTCAYQCNDCCKYHHWVLDIPLGELNATAALSLDQIAEGASQDPSVLAVTLPNTSQKREFQPFCPPSGQVHAYLFKAIAYRMEGTKQITLAGAQSKPLLFSLDRPSASAQPSLTSPSQ